MAGSQREKKDPALKASSGRKRLNVQGTLDLETFQFTFVSGEKINAETTKQMQEKLERNNPAMTAVHVFVDNAPHLSPIERHWGMMHKWVIHNRHYVTFNQFTETILGFFRKTRPDKWKE